MKKKKRHNYTPEEKVLILKRHLTEGVAVSALCEEYCFASVGNGLCSRLS